MRSPLLFALLRVGMLGVCSASAAAQLASEVAVLHRDGQTFVTWRESPLAGVRYRVYRAEAPILGEGDLAAADWLGEVDDKSSLDVERGRVEHGPRTWVIAEGNAPLDSSQGLFVHTVAADGPACYAVTSVRGKVENRTLTPGVNTTADALAETCAPPRPVLQAIQTGREVWGHWVGNRDTPFQPALSLTPSHAFVLGYERGTAAGAHGLLLRLHAAGGNYAQGWPPRALVPQDVDVLALSDLHAVSGYDFWFGEHELFPGEAVPGIHVQDDSLRRVLWTLAWFRAHEAATLDPARVYLAGSSLGAIGGMYLVQERPELFASALLRSGNYDLRAGDMADTTPFERLYGGFDLDLPLPSGLGVLERTSSPFMAHLDPARDWPLIRTIDGRQDTRVGWRSAVGLYGALRETWRPAVEYFDERAHAQRGHWSGLERKLVERTCLARLDRPSLCFTSCSLDEDAGDGERTDGDTYGTLAGHVEYDPLTAAASADDVRFDVYLRAQGALDDAKVGAGYAELTPRRTAPFALVPGEGVHFTLHEGADLVDEQWLVADELGFVHTAFVPLSKTRRAARFERAASQALAAGPGLALGERVGGALCAGLSGRPGEPWQLVLLPGDGRGPFWLRGLGHTAQGALDERGRADVRGVLPQRVLTGSRIWARARIGERWTPWRSALGHDAAR